MTEKLVIGLTIDQSLIDYFIEGGHEDENHAAATLVDFLANFLNDTRYPFEANKTGAREIELKYHLRPFADPIF